MAKTQPIHAFTIAVVVIISTCQIILAEGRHIDIKSVKKANSIPTPKSYASRESINPVHYTAGGSHINSSKPFGFNAVRIAIEPQSGAIASPAQEAGQSERLAPVKSYTTGLKHTLDLASPNDSVQKRRFQEMSTTPDYYAADDINGHRPPPRVSTVPAHSPGDGH